MILYFGAAVSGFRCKSSEPRRVGPAIVGSIGNSHKRRAAWDGLLSWQASTARTHAPRSGNRDYRVVAHERTGCSIHTLTHAEPKVNKILFIFFRYSLNEPGLAPDGPLPGNSEARAQKRQMQMGWREDCHWAKPTHVAASPRGHVVIEATDNLDTLTGTSGVTVV